MAWSATLTHMDFDGSLKRMVWNFNAASVTSGSIVTGLSRIVFTELHNKTGQRGVVDDTTTAGTVAISGVTSNDIGYVVVHGV